MGIFKNLRNKIVIITIVVVLGSFLLSKPVSAKSFLAQAGGKLIEPIGELLVFARRLCYKCITN